MLSDWVVLCAVLLTCSTARPQLQGFSASLKCPARPSAPQTYAATALVIIAVLNRLPIKLLPGQRGAGRRHSSSTSAQVGGFFGRKLFVVGQQDTSWTCLSCTCANATA